MFLIILYIFSMIRFILTIAVVYLIIRWILKLFSSRVSENYHDTNPQNHPEEGETTIHYKKQQKKKSAKDKGEYVDFEEIE